MIDNADMAELADAQDLGSCGAIRAGSSPVIRTKKTDLVFDRSVFFYVKKLQYGKREIPHHTKIKVDAHRSAEFEQPDRIYFKSSGMKSLVQNNIRDDLAHG